MSTASYTSRSFISNTPVVTPRATPFDYALFTLPHVLLNGIHVVTNEKAAVIIPFQATLMSAMSGSFILKPGNGVTANLSIVRPGDMFRQEYEYGDDMPLRITSMVNELSSPEEGTDSHGFLIQPLIPWLEPGQRFHIFRISFGCGHRGQKDCGTETSVIPDLLFGVQRPD